jgi:hypothetical protein
VPIGVEDAARPLSVGLFLAVFLPTAAAVVGLLISLSITAIKTRRDADGISDDLRTLKDKVDKLNNEFHETKPKVEICLEKVLHRSTR